MLPALSPPLELDLEVEWGKIETKPKIKINKNKTKNFCTSQNLGACWRLIVLSLQQHHVVFIHMKDLLNHSEFPLQCRWGECRHYLRSDQELVAHFVHQHLLYTGNTDWLDALRVQVATRHPVGPRQRPGRPPPPYHLGQGLRPGPSGDGSRNGKGRAPQLQASTWRPTYARPPELPCQWKGCNHAASNPHDLAVGSAQCARHATRS